MNAQIQLGDSVVDVVWKDIKNIHLSVHPPTGRVRLSAPARMSFEALRLFAVSKVGWIRRHQKSLREQERETPREYLDRESHFLWGRRYLLAVEESFSAASVQPLHNRLVLTARPGATREQKREIMEGWYREQVKRAATPLVAHWEPRVGVRAARVFVQHMKTKWGSCNARRAFIRLNTELAKKPPECLEYVIVHELIHLIEPSHNARFVELMGRLLPKWKAYRDQLNALPVRHEDWDC